MVTPWTGTPRIWTIVLFFGASIMFAAIKNATEDEGAGVALGAQLAARAACSWAC